jgi:hypothetical protein
MRQPRADQTARRLEPSRRPAATIAAATGSQTACVAGL